MSIKKKKGERIQLSETLPFDFGSSAESTLTGTLLRHDDKEAVFEESETGEECSVPMSAGLKEALAMNVNGKPASEQGFTWFITLKGRGSDGNWYLIKVE